MIFNSSSYNNNWRTKALNELGKFQRGKSRHRPRNDKQLFIDGEFPLIQTGEIKDANLYLNSHKSVYNKFGLKQSKLWDKDTLCITIAANIAETAILSYPMCFPDSIVGFNAYKNESSEIFMYYIFKYIKTTIQRTATGSIQDNINIDYLTNLKFKIPLKNEQDKIANILSTLDKKIELNNKINAELEAMEKTLYDYWFVQFDFPNAEGKPYKSSGGKMVYSEELKREIPEGWEFKTLENYAEVRKGTLITAKTVKQGNVKVVSAGINYTYFHSESNRKKYTITVSGSGANAGFINFWREPIFANDCITLRGCSDIETILIRQYLNHLQNYLFSQAIGSAQPHVYPSDLKKIKYVVPKSTLVDKIKNIFLSNNNKIANNNIENQSLKAQRDFLLPMLMNGQVSVK